MTSLSFAMALAYMQVALLAIALGSGASYGASPTTPWLPQQWHLVNLLHYAEDIFTRNGIANWGTTNKEIC